MPILATTDLSDNSKPAIRSAARMASVRETALVVLFCDEAADQEATWRYFVQTPWEDTKARHKKARQKLDDFLDETLEESLRPSQLEVRVEPMKVDRAFEKLADEETFELVVVGATGASGLERVFLGSTAEEIVRSSPWPVLVVPQETELRTMADILAPVDLSECSRASLEYAADLARRSGAHLHILRALALPTAAVVPFEFDVPPVDPAEYREEAGDALAEFVDELGLQEAEFSLESVVETPHSAIVEAAEERGSDLIVMGTHGRRGFERLFLGSTASKVLHRIPCPVLTVRHQPESSR